MSTNTVALTSENFKETVLDSEIPVVVDFWAPWCAPCRMLAPVIEELADELDGAVVFGKLDTDSEGEIAIAYGVGSIPTLILFKNGEEIARLSGLRSKEAILAFIQQN